MDGALKELAKLEKLAAGGSIGKGKAPAIDQSLDALLDSLRAAKQRYLAVTGSQETLLNLSKEIEGKKARRGGHISSPCLPTSMPVPS